MTDTIIREVKSPVWQNNNPDTGKVIGSFIYREFESGKYEVLCSNEKVTEVTKVT